MEQYESNSYASKRKNREEEQKEAPKKEIQQICKANVKKKSKFQKFVGTFIQDDADSVGSYLIQDVLIPALKKTFFDMITNGSEMMIFGSEGGRSRKKSPASTVSYRDYYRDRYDDPRDRERYVPRSVQYSLDDIILETRADAENVLITMDEIRERYDGIVTVLDLYELVGAPSRHTDAKYGWTSLRNASVERVRDGYQLRLPRPMPID